MRQRSQWTGSGRAFLNGNPAARVRIALETTAGQGSSIGHRFEHIRDILNRIESNERVVVCLDTCHVFAAGYDFRTRKDFESLKREFDCRIGLDKLAVIHVNDSKKKLGSRVDRHDHIGRGEIGLEGFRHFLNESLFDRIPKILETPKGDDLKEDRENLAKLRKLIARE